MGRWVEEAQACLQEAQLAELAERSPLAGDATGVKLIWSPGALGLVPLAKQKICSRCRIIIL